MTTTTTSLPTADQIADKLPRELATTLALLHPADDELAELTLGLLPLGSREMLQACGVVDLRPRERLDDPVSVSLTDLGRDVITACALRGLPEEVNEYIDALESARTARTSARAAHSGDTARR